MEKLYAHCFLWALGLTDGETYGDTLHRQFRARPACPLLFALEESLSDTGHRLCLLEGACNDGSNAFAQDAFARELFSGLRAVYRENRFPLPVLGGKCHRLWEALPESLRYQQPFHALEYAQDSLAWGDEAGMRAHLEAAIAMACE